MNIQELKSKSESSRATYGNAINRIIPRGLDMRDEMERAKRRRTAMREWDKLGNPVIVAGPYFRSRAMRRQ